MMPGVILAIANVVLRALLAAAMNSCVSGIAPEKQTSAGRVGQVAWVDGLDARKPEVVGCRVATNLATCVSHSGITGDRVGDRRRHTWCQRKYPDRQVRRSQACSPSLRWPAFSPDTDPWPEDKSHRPCRSCCRRSPPDCMFPQRCRSRHRRTAHSTHKSGAVSEQLASSHVSAIHWPPIGSQHPENGAQAASGTLHWSLAQPASVLQPIVVPLPTLVEQRAPSFFGVGAEQRPVAMLHVP